MNLFVRWVALTGVLVILSSSVSAESVGKSRKAFKVVQNMLTLVRTEYIEDTPPSTIVSEAFKQLDKSLKKRKIEHKLPPVPPNLSPKEAEVFLAKEFESIATKHPDTLEKNWLAHRTIEGLVEGLGDKYTVFMDPDEFRRLKESMSGGNFGGVGIYIQLDKKNSNRLTVARPIPDTPAADAGMKRGDVIIAIDGKSTQGFTIDDAQALLRGPLGTEVVLRVRRLKQAKPFDVKLKRDKIRVSSVSSRLRTAKGHKVGYIRLRVFGDKTNTELEKAMRKLESQGVEGFMLDLRNNGGGYIVTAVDVVSKFLPTGSVVTSVEERGSGNKIYYTRPSLRRPLPLVLLVNQYSASASEITAAAMADHQRASLIGVKTFGKGSVQKIFNLPDGSGVKITTAHYHTPHGKDINGVGIEPSQEVEFEGRSLNGADDSQFKSAALALVKSIESGKKAAGPSALPKARTGVEQWRYLQGLGRGEPKVVSRKYLVSKGGESLLEELKVVFSDSDKPEVIRFDLGPALGLSS